MHFIRSLPGKPLDCSLGYGEQSNMITHYLDGSNVYGSGEEEATLLRAGSSGRLRVTARAGRELLPTQPEEESGDCGIPERDRRAGQLGCFHAGDGRVNEQPGLAALHTVWVREHNRLADLLAATNPHWDGERLYQEARQLVVAQLQQVTYTEWLPIILGTQFMRSLNLTVESVSHYDRAVDPSIVNSFATAAFRFGHSLVAGLVR